MDHDLPGRTNLNQVGIKGSILQLAMAVAGNTHDAQEVRLAHEEEKLQDKLLSQCWMALINKLLEYCNFTSEMHLLPLWLALAKLNKKQGLSIMQDEVTTYAGSPHCFSRTAPIISPQLV